MSRRDLGAPREPVLEVEPVDSTMVFCGVGEGGEGRRGVGRGGEGEVNIYSLFGGARIVWRGRAG